VSRCHHITFKEGPIPPGFSRRPAPGEKCYVVEAINNGWSIRHGICYAVDVEVDDEGTLIFTRWYEGDVDHNPHETCLQQDTFFWFQDAQGEAVRRTTEEADEAKEKEEETPQ